MERDQLQRVMEEQNLGMTGMLDDETVIQIGKLLGVDGMIFGEASTYAVEPDIEITETVKEKKHTGKYRTVKKKNKKTGSVPSQRSA